jgi:F-type H+-transporting ATPase subunit alpha
VVQIYAATNGYLDRITVDKVSRFLDGLTESVRGNEPELLKKIADDDWGDETQNAVDQAVSRYAEDFGFDLDEEGHPIEDETEESRPAEQRSEDEEQSEEKKEEQEEAVPA